jgi:hypothetical protein
LQICKGFKKTQKLLLTALVLPSFTEKADLIPLYVL